MSRVYGGNLFVNGKQVRGIFNGTKREVAVAIRASLHYVNGYWSETGNVVEVKVATSRPKTLFWTDKHYYNKTESDYQELKEN